MKGNVMTSAPLCLLLFWMLPVHSLTIHFNFTRRDANTPIPLSMVEESVDDMFFGCTEEMMEAVRDKYFEEEKHAEPFADAWAKATECAKMKFEHREDKALTEEHMQAICLYTSNDIYKEFNDAVRTKASTYGSSFQFHSLHFLLTSAVQILNSKYYCHTTYRRTTVEFTGKVNQRIRFGSFTSSSYKTNLNFGSQTCFKIKTCSGAFLKKYSVFEDEEAEVLIPPYEVFRITERIEGQVKIQGLTDCKLVYVLESTGANSRLNCKVVYK